MIELLVIQVFDAILEVNHMIIRRNIRHYLRASLYAGICEFARFVKISFIFGSKTLLACKGTLFFSGAQCISPLIGYYYRASAVCMLFALRTFAHCLLAGMSGLLLQLHIPTFCAGLYSSSCRPARPDRSGGSESYAVRVAMALGMLSCIVLFVLHPVGNGAFLYALPWLLPLFNALITHKSIFIHALATTYSAHAVGSVIWLYSVGPTSSQAWLELMPIACLERLLFACGMTAIIVAVPVAKRVFGKLFITAPKTI